MKVSASVRLAILGSTLLIGTGGLFAQSGSTSKSICMSTGSSTPEAIGDRDGHFVQVSTSTCRIEGGPLDGGVMTQNSIWEMDKANANLTSGNGVVRMAGGVAIYQTTGGSRTLIIKDGKVAGWTASGKSVFVTGAGSAAAVAGKPFSWTARLTGLNQYTIDTVMD